MSSQLPVLEERVVCDNTYLTNIKRGEDKPPAGEGWVYYLFVTRHVVKQGKKQKVKQTKRSIHEIKAISRNAADEKLYEFINQRNVTLVDEETGRIVPKNGKEDDGEDSVPSGDDAI